MIQVGDPFSKESEQGPQVDGEQQEKVKISFDKTETILVAEPIAVTETILVAVPVSVQIPVVYPVSVAQQYQ